MTDGQGHGDGRGTMHGVFRQRAAEHPDALALIHRDTTVSYRTLDRASDAFAAELADAAVGAGDVVPVLMPRSPTFVAVVLAVLKRGAAYAAMDPRWPRSRVAELVAQTDAPLIAATPDQAEGWSRPVWVPEADLARVAAAPAPRLDTPPVEETDTACVFFTSGSTGRPKGVLSPHAGTVRLFGPDRFMAVGPGTVMSQAAPLPWDAASLELWSMLLSGGTSVLIDEPYLTADGLRTLVRDTGLNTLWLTASVFHMLVEEDLDCFDGIRQLLAGGERLSPAHVRRFVAAHPGTALVNGYGPAESTVFATTHRITPEDCATGADIPVGRPVPRTEVFVLDERSRPCPPGTTGEICVTGAGLANGYLADPERTAKSFADIDLGAGGPRRMYRTGDLGRFSADGVLHYAGRADRQVKVRGHRVEPGEVEARVAELPGVRRCVVIPLMSAGACVGLAAAYTCADGRPVGEDTVRTALAAHLPEYLMPRTLTAVDGFPLTGNGKLDTEALLERVTRDAGPQAPAAPHPRPHDRSTAGLVAHAFAEALHTDGTVPYDTSFFAMGGDSLDGARLCVRIGARTGVPVPPSVFVAGPTVRELAQWIEARTETARTPAPEDRPAPGEPLPLLPTQSGFLFEQQLDPTDTSAHCELIWRVTGDFAPEAFRAAVADVHRRHQSLHARYVFDRRPVALLDERITPVRTTELAPAAHQDAALAAVRATLGRPLDIGTGENWRCVLAPEASGRAWLLGIVVHHIAFDGASIRPLADDLSAAYAARLRHRTPDTAPPPSLAAVLAGARAQVDETGLAEQRTFWRDEATGVPPLTVPGPDDGDTRPRPTFRLTAAEWAALETRAHGWGSTRFAVALAAYAEALALVSGDRDLAIGAPIAKRYHPDTADAVGCLIDVLCFRMRPAGDGTADHVPALLAGVHAALAAQDVPFEDVVRMAADPARDRSRHPLFQTLFALQSAPPRNLTLDGCETVVVGPRADRALHELEVEVWPEHDGGAEVVFGHRPGTAARFVADVAAAYRRLLRELAAGADRT
ncbi:non-ribosomal peptide synthetase [Streptomyces sp. A1-5]|uniref:non-ribosomal peptide synthetase n=1 Tax=Streptomyces sp. A1-5 TaxID=2738410 RepID=UPI001F3A5118|nr:non-ribosomal peptide synthetase [Streptomyces sp. A1-5]UJB39747.1 amino acid adenylation domain-containing protein [Streptomyces sp. A1-5]